MASENYYDGNRPLGYYSGLNAYQTYSWINNEQFYSLVPAQYRDYYQRFIRRYFYWYDGFVPYFHNPNSGMFSTKLAYTVLHSLALQTIGNKLMFNDDGVKDTKVIDYNGKKLNSLEFVEAWSKKHRLTNKMVQAKEWAFVGGDSVIKLDNVNGELEPTVLRKDQYFFSTDFVGHIDEFSAFIYDYQKIVNLDNGEKEYYYVLEQRQYDENHTPQVRIIIKKGNGNSITTRQADGNLETIPFNRLPRDVSHKFKRDFPNVELGEWQELPFKNLGIFVDKASEKVSNIPSLPFGESLLANAIPILMTYDFYYSSLNTNLYTARDRVIIPQHMQAPNSSNGYPVNQNNGLDSYMYAMVNYVDPENQKPVVLQFDIRDWKQVRDNLLQTFAMTIGVDDRTISSSIVPNSEKPTAREISSNESKTILFVENQQSFSKCVGDELIDTLLDFYDFKDEVITIKFSKAGLVNVNNLTQVVTIMKQNGGMSLETMIRMFHTDWNEKQIQNEVNAIKQEQQEQLKQQEQPQTDVEEGIEQDNNTDISHIKKPKQGILSKIFKK